MTQTMVQPILEQASNSILHPTRGLIESVVWRVQFLTHLPSSKHKQISYGGDDLLVIGHQEQHVLRSRSLRL